MERARLGCKPVSAAGGRPEDGSLRHLLILEVTTAPLVVARPRRPPEGVETHGGGERLDALAWLRAEMRVSDGRLRFSVLDLHGVSAGSAAGEPLLLHAAAQEFGRSRHPLLVTFGGRSRALPFLRFRGLAHRISMPQLYPSLDQDAYFEPSGRDWHLDLDEVLGAGGLDSRASLEGVAAALGYPSPPQGASCDPGALELRAVTVYALLLTLLRHTDRVSAEGFTLAAADAADVLTAQAMADERMRRLLDALEAAAAAI